MVRIPDEVTRYKGKAGKRINTGIPDEVTKYVGKPGKLIVTGVPDEVTIVNKDTRAQKKRVALRQFSQDLNKHKKTLAALLAKYHHNNTAKNILLNIGIHINSMSSHIKNPGILSTSRLGLIEFSFESLARKVSIVNDQHAQHELSAFVNVLEHFCFDLISFLRSR